jgi:hypothetical protein
MEEGAANLAAFAEGLSEAQWNTPVPPDGRTVGVIIHHVASVYPIEVHLASVLASGKPVEGVDKAALADMNAKHAHEHAEAGRQETIDLLRRNCAAAGETVRAFTDEQLDTAAPLSLNAGATLTAQFMIEDHAIHHSRHHLQIIRAALHGA